MTDTSLASLIWNVAHPLRGDYKRSEYGRVIPAFDEDVQAYFDRDIRPHTADAGADHEKTAVGYGIPFNRHFYLFKPPRDLTAIDAGLKAVTDRTMTPIGGLSR